MLMLYTLCSVSYSTLKHSYIIWSASVIDNHTAVVCLYVYKSIFVSIILICSRSIGNKSSGTPDQAVVFRSA